MRVSNQQFYTQSLVAMLNQQAKLLKTQNQVALGTRLLTPADDPSASQRVLEIDQAIGVTAQFQTNADIAISRLEQEEGLLANASNVLQRVRELTLQGKSGQMTEADRKFIASEVRNRLEELVGIANARDTNGEYMFAGFQSQTRPFAPNAAGNIVYQGDQGNRSLRISHDRLIPDGDNGHDVFVAIRTGNGRFTATPAAGNTGTGIIETGNVVDPTTYLPHSYTITFTSATTYDVVNATTGATVATAQPYTAGTAIGFGGLETAIIGAPATGDVFTIAPSGSRSLFATVESLIAGLEMEIANPTVGAEFAHVTNRVLTDIDQAMENLLRVRTTVGARLKSIDTQKLVNDDLKLQFADVRSKLADLDITEASIALNQDLVALQAAQQAFVRTQGLSLFNLL